MADVIPGPQGETQTQVQTRAKDHSPSSFVLDSHSAESCDNQHTRNSQHWDTDSVGNLCSSAKQHRKMQNNEEVSLTYSWEQTNSDVAVTVRLKGLNDESFNITFTNAEVHIGISEDRQHKIQFFDTIQKEKSRVQLKKGRIILIVVKQEQGLWPALEAKGDMELNTEDREAGCGDGKHCSQDHTSNFYDGNNCDMRRLSGDGRGLAENSSEETVMGKEREESIQEDQGREIVDKDEEPVQHLDLMKHDFFERDLIFTVQVYIKSLNKDAVKIVFNKQGFVLKFHTCDPKFLQLHEGTSAETTFSWSVTTRQNIIPDECKFTVKQTGLEIALKKTSGIRWASLEAPRRKEIVEASRSDSWMPLNRSNDISTTDVDSMASTSSSSSSSSSSSFDTFIASSSTTGPNRNMSKKSPNVMFDDIGNVHVKDTGERPSGFAWSSYPQRSEVEEDSSYNARLKSNNVYPDWNKPTAKVLPLNQQGPETAMVISPGFAGLVNLGNTCFMNSVLQVLANTREFRDYFLDGRFQHEINEDNPLGMKGHLAATFGVLLRWLWSCKKHCWEPRKLKELISKKNPQFFGYAQHDAHEFLAFLLDGLHEDLNRIRKKPYTETIDSDGRPDEVVAAEAWTQYKKRNDSVVVDMFQGQYKSKLVCPRCGKVSITFDPFLYLSVPLPKKKKLMSVTFMWKESYKKPVRFQILVSQDSTVEKLKEELSQRTAIKTCDIRVFEAYRGRILKFFLNGASLSSVEPKDVIIACEVLSEDLAGEEVLEIPVMQRTLLPSNYPTRCAFCHKTCLDGSPLKRCTKCFKVGYCDHTCQRNHWNLHKSLCSTSPEPIGCPFILSLPASRATYGHLVKHMEGFARFSVDVFQPPVKSSEVGSKPLGSVPGSNLNSSLSQSCSSLNSLDSLSSASSTCTLTGDQSDPPSQPELGEDVRDSAANSLNDPEQFVTPLTPTLISSTSPQASMVENLPSLDVSDNSIDSGFDSNVSKVMPIPQAMGAPPTVDKVMGVPPSGPLPSVDRVVPMSQVMGVQAGESPRDRASTTFFIKPVSMEGMGIKGAERLEDKGHRPLELINRRFLSMDWRNNEKLSSYVLVQSKELEAEDVDNLNNLTAMSAASGNKPSLYQCLELFTEPEVLSPEEAWYCPSCKKHVEASKQMSIWRLPHTLIVQLKRFSFQHSLMRSKIKKHVEFPIRGLDLSKYCVGMGDGEPPPIYDLYGVANHHGLLIGGHYTSYVRCSGDSHAGTDLVGWRLCDDSRVSPIFNEKSVVTADAYLLFYRRQGYSADIGTSTADRVANLAGSSPASGLEMRGPSLILPAPNRNPTIYSNLEDEDDERNGNIAKTTPSERMKECMNNRLLSEMREGEGSTRASYHAFNQQLNRVPHPEPIDSTDLHISCEETGEEVKTEQWQEMEEKADKEKDVDDCDKNKLETSTSRDDDISLDCREDGLGCGDDDDYDKNVKNLVIDLGYTDMEAVD